MILRVLALTCAAALAACVEFPATPPDGTGATAGLGDPGTGASGGFNSQGGMGGRDACIVNFALGDNAGDNDDGTSSGDRLAIGEVDEAEDNFDDWVATTCSGEQRIELSWTGSAELELSVVESAGLLLTPDTQCICAEPLPALQCRTLTGELGEDGTLTLEVRATSVFDETRYMIEFCPEAD
ncbi:MAG: hypothetical protein AAF500_07455 [Myxococcota bacterium]